MPHVVLSITFGENMFNTAILNICIFLLFTINSYGSYLLIPMNTEQKNHLKAYGITYWVLKQNVESYWLLNYENGSFAFKYAEPIEKECKIRDVSYKVISDGQFGNILSQINDPEVNQDVIKLEKAPKVAVYSPKSKQPWDDAVTLVLTYAEIPYDVVYDDELMSDKLLEYDWLHLHHEDFTGQLGKFYASYHTQPWYQEQERELETSAKKYGFEKISQLRLAIAHKIRDFVMGGGFLFAMCSATDSYDIALGAEGVDICGNIYDGDAMEPDAQNKIDFEKCFAFENFKISTNPYQYEYSNIDASPENGRNVAKESDYFTLFEFSAKWDPIPTMLTQCQTKTIKGFMGQSTAFNENYIKKSTLILGENKAANEAKYIHGEYGKGTWTFYGGHDPEDYQHMVYDPPTDLSLHPNSPGYRLILNNILFPAAKKQKRKT